MVQRLLAARNEGESRLALFSSWIVIAVQFTLFLVHRRHSVRLLSRDRRCSAVSGRPDLPAIHLEQPSARHRGSGDRRDPGGRDVKPERGPKRLGINNDHGFLQAADDQDSGVGRSESHYLRLARLATLAWGVVLFLIGLVARNWGSVLEAGLSIASILYGALLGVFLLGLLTRRTSESGAMAGMVASLLMMFYVKQYTSIAWTWYVLIGSATTVAVGISRLVCSTQARPHD